jgi:cytochrome c-type biogenesis protein CcmH/NrfG
MIKIIVTVSALLLSGCAVFPESSAPDSAPDAPEQPYLDSIAARASDPESWFRLGNRYAEQNQLEQAEQAYRRALQHNEDYSAARHNLGLVQIRMGVEALRVAAAQLPVEHPVHAETRRFLQVILTVSLPSDP